MVGCIECDIRLAPDQSGSKCRSFIDPSDYEIWGPLVVMVHPNFATWVNSLMVATPDLLTSIEENQHEYRHEEYL